MDNGEKIKGLKIINMKYLNIYRNVNKKRKSKNLLLNYFINQKNNSIQKISDFTSLKEENEKDEKDKNKFRQFSFKNDISKKNLNISKKTNNIGSFTSKNKNIITPNINLKLDSYKNKKHKLIFSTKRKLKWDQFGILNLSEKKFKKKKIELDYLNNANIIERIRYNQKIKGINSSFSPKSSFYNEKKLIRDISSKNILFNESIFSDYSNLNSPKEKKYKSQILYKKEDIRKVKFNNILVPHRKIYQFIICQDFAGKIKKFNDLPEGIKKMNKKSIQSLEKNNEKLFINYYSVVDPKKFKEEYQNPFTSPFERKIYNKENKKYINEEAFKFQNKLLKDMIIELNKYNKKQMLNNDDNKKNEYISTTCLLNNNKKPILEKFKRVIIQLSNYLKELSLSIPEILIEYRIVKICFTYRQTKDLIYAIKEKKIEACNKLLDNYKYIVLDYDYYYLTPLHWAVKKNFYQIIPKLIEYGSIINFQNFIKDTPLHIGVKNNSYECVCLLLFNLASPFIKGREGKKPIELTNDFQMKYLLEKFMKFYYLSLFYKLSIQTEMIQKNFSFFIVEEFKKQLDHDIFLYFKEKEIKYRKNKNN